MDYEIEISMTKDRISDIESRIAEIGEEIKQAEYAKRDAEDGATLGLLQMSSSALRPIGTYNFLNETGNVGDIRIKIKDLEQEKKDLEWSLWEEKNKLKSLKEEFEFSKRPQAELVAEEGRIYIKGDEKKYNIITWLEHELKSYRSEYERVLASEDVDNYKKLKEKFEKLVKETPLPEASKENIAKLDALKKEYGLQIKYIIMDGKLIVEDCFSKAIETSTSLAGYYEQDIKKAQEKYDKFEPTFMGKVFRSVRKKQKQSWDSKIAESEKYFVSSLESQREKIKVYEGAKKEFVEPADEVLTVLAVLNKQIKESYYVSKYINELDKYKENIENHTILKDKNVNSILFSALSSLNYYLDKNNLKLTREDILDAIFESEHHQELAQEIYNAIGYKPRKKKKVVATVQEQSK